MKTLTIVLNGEQAESLLDLLSDCDIHDEEDVLLELFDELVSIPIDTPENAELKIDVSSPL